MILYIIEIIVLDFHVNKKTMTSEKLFTLSLLFYFRV